MDIYNKMTYIYLVENCYGDLNKVYIGKTKNSRFLPHKKTYGEYIKYTVIDEISSLLYKDWEPLETYWIEQFKHWGFDVVNIRKKGGNGVITHTEEVRIKIGLKNKGRSNPNVSKANKGREITWRDKISKSLLGKKRNINYINYIYQYDLQGNFLTKHNNAREACKYLNLNKWRSADILSCIKGRQKTAFGYIWKKD